MLVSTIFNIRVSSDYAWFKYNEFVKVLALFIFITLTVKTKRDIDTFIWAIVLGLSAYAGMEAVKFILSGGGHRIVGRSGILQDRNDLAVAINMAIPLILYLWSVTKHKHLKIGLIGLALLNVVAIVGTYSRGGFIGLVILAFAIWLKSNRKLLFAFIAILAMPILYANAPTEWKERQATVETASTEDGSFIGRLWAWKIATLIALDNPITGGGFKATTDAVLWRMYANETPDFGPIYTKPIPPELTPKAAHNIYFQVLASAGFFGLFVFLCMLSKAYFLSQKNKSRSKKAGIKWSQTLSDAICLSLVAYGITGLNVSLAYFELVYAMLGIIVAIDANKLYEKPVE